MSTDQPRPPEDWQPQQPQQPQQPPAGSSAGGYPPPPPAGYPPPPSAGPQGPGYPSAPGYQAGPGGYSGPGAYAPPQEDPGRTLGIVGLILSFFTALIGLVVSIIAWRKSRRAGFSNTPAVIGIIVGAVTTLLAIIVTIVAITAIATVANKCQQLGPGVHQEGGVTYSCP